MEISPKCFLRGWLPTLIVLVGVVAAFDFLVDPDCVFDTPRLPGFSAHKGVRYHHEWLFKAYEVRRVKPRTVLLGSSRVAIGLDAVDPSWPTNYRPVYNLGMSAASPYVSYRYLQHVMSGTKPDTVVMGLDFEYFLDTPEAQRPTDQGFERRLEVTSDGRPNPRAKVQRVYDLIQSTLSFDSLSDSIATAYMNALGDTTDTIGGNVPPDELFAKQRVGIGTFPYMEFMNILNFRRFAGTRNRFAVEDIQAILELCASRGTRVIFYISPMHAETLEMLDRRGYWSSFEDWKRELVRQVSRYQRENRASRIDLWDFSDYDAYSTEAVRQDRRVLQWFWEAWHYTRALGDLITKRILDMSDEPFGTLLTSANLEAHLSAIRERRRQYRENHAEDARRVQTLYDSETRVLRQAAMSLH